MMTAVTADCSNFVPTDYVDTRFSKFSQQLEILQINANESDGASVITISLLKFVVNEKSCCFTTFFIHILNCGLSDKKF